MNLIFSILKKTLPFLFLFLFLRLVFIVYRLLFLFYNDIYFDGHNFLKCLINSIKYDLGIILGLITIFILVSFIPFKSLKVKYLETFIIFCLYLGVNIIHLSDIILYKNWGSLLNIKIFDYKANIFSITNFLTNIEFIGIFVFVPIVSFLMTLFTSIQLNNIKKSLVNSFKFVLILILIILSIFFLRGGFRQIPLNHSDAIHQQDYRYNLISINSTWNFYTVIIDYFNFYNTNQYDKLDFKKNNKIFESLFTINNNETKNLFIKKESNPNIILLVMEGISYDMLENIENKKIMPFLDSISNHSYNFSKAFAVGFRTEQGLGALLSGTFCLPYKTLIQEVDHQQKISSLYKILKRENYSTHFYFGGDSEFCNFKSFLFSQNVDKIIDINNFSDSNKTQKLGINDYDLLNTVYDNISKEKSPFFATILTQSTHEPYDIEINKNIDNEKKKHINAARYLDNSLYNFFLKMSKTKIFDNTIFIITSDHGHKYPKDSSIYNSNRYHIPLIIYSKLLSKENQGINDTILFRQNNFPATLLKLLNFTNKDLCKHSVNHFSDAKKFTFSAFVNGFLYQEPNYKLKYEYTWVPIDKKKPLDIIKSEIPFSILQSTNNELKNKKEIKKYD